MLEKNYLSSRIINNYKTCYWVNFVYGIRGSDKISINISYRFWSEMNQNNIEL